MPNTTRPQPEQLPLPEPPDVAGMVAATQAKQKEWFGMITAARDDGRLSQNEWLLTLQELEKWDVYEDMRIDRLYCNFYGIR